MWRRHAPLLAMGFLIVGAQPSLSQSTPPQPTVAEKVQTITESLKVLCLSGGSESSLSVKGDLDLKAKIKDILTGNIGAAAKGATEFNKQVWDGIIGGISKDMTEIQGRQASEARKCMTDMGFPLVQEALKQR
jgi:hypothetical protein